MVLRDPGLDVERQAEQINSMLDMGISALIVTPVSFIGLSDVLQRARDMGVKYRAGAESRALRTPSREISVLKS